jgi:hypothetical protein
LPTIQDVQFHPSHYKQLYAGPRKFEIVRVGWLAIMHLRNTSVLLNLAAAILITCSNVHAGRPLVIDDAAPVPVNHIELEFGLYGKRFDSGEQDHTRPAIGLAYGVYPEVEIGMTLRRVDRHGTQSHSHGFEDLHLTTKYRIIEETPSLPAFAVDLDIKLPTANRSKGKSDQSFRMSVTKNLYSVAAHLNLGYALIQSPSGDKLRNRIHGGAATEWLFRPGFALVAEIFAASRQAQGLSNELEFQLGVKYAPTPQLVLDTAIGRSLRSIGTRVQGTIGLTWMFDVGELFTR